MKKYAKTAKSIAMQNIIKSFLNSLKNFKESIISKNVLYFFNFFYVSLIDRPLKAIGTFQEDFALIRAILFALL